MYSELNYKKKYFLLRATLRKLLQSLRESQRLLRTLLEHSGSGAFIVKRDRFRDVEGLRRYVKDELGVALEGTMKGSGRIRYGYTADPLAIGDAKMATLPFFGWGMKHAIESARLMAACLAGGDWRAYAPLHRSRFRRQRAAASLLGGIYDSPMAWVLRPFVSNPRLFERVYRWIHA